MKARSPAAVGVAIVISMMVTFGEIVGQRALSKKSDPVPSATAATEWPHLINSGRVSPFTYREEFDDGSVCYRSARGADLRGEPFLDGLSCVFVPK